MPKKKVASNFGLGKSLIKTRTVKAKQWSQGDEGPTGGFKVHTTFESEKKPQLASILEQSSLDEFVQLAQMSKKQFEGERQATIVTGNQVIPMSANSVQNHANIVANFLPDGHNLARGGKYRPLKIPRRPAWTKSMTANQIAQQENISFLEWRRDVAMMEQNNVTLAITPFEKNLEVWKQLWRVIEKSDLLLQIVDGRNPYFFYSQDLEKYIAEVSKKDPENPKEFILLINKADYMSPELIAHWNQYFNEKGVTHLFFSALLEQEKLDGEELYQEEGLELDEVDESDSEDEDESDDEEEEEDRDNKIKEEAEGDDEDDQDEEAVSDGEGEKEVNEQMVELGKEEAEQQKAELTPFAKELEEQALIEDEQEKVKQKRQQEEDDAFALELKFNTPEVYSRVMLLGLLRQKAHKRLATFGETDEQIERLTVGTVGYPNVGKSSVINVLVGQKKVGVAALPGKTKHFQTLFLDDELELCDCPGLVFPSFANSKAEMMSCGVLPIDSMRDFVNPIELLMTRIPKEVLEIQYKVKLPPRESRLYTVSTFLQLYASRRGWITGRSLPNEVQAAKTVMKDFTTGKLLFCAIRPDYNIEKHGDIVQCGFRMDIEAHLHPEPSAQNYEELKREEETHATAIAGEQHQPHTKTLKSFTQLENDVDAEFFAPDKKLFKLNKAEKRALKFSLKNGEKLDESTDLKAILGERVKQTKKTHNTNRGVASAPGDAPQKKKGVMKVSDYRQLDGINDQF